LQRREHLAFQEKRRLPQLRLELDPIEEIAALILQKLKQ
jgi:hypothetical protein